MTIQIDGEKRAGKQYPCPFCLSTHTYPAGISRCLDNPNREANMLKISESNRKRYYASNTAERLRQATKSETARLKKSNSTKKMWEEGRLPDNKGENNGMYGKTHSLETRLKQSKANAKMWQEGRIDQKANNLSKAIDRENIVTPIFDRSHDFFRPAMDKHGFVEVQSDQWNGNDDEFDPFH